MNYLFFPLYLNVAICHGIVTHILAHFKSLFRIGASLLTIEL